MVATVGNVVFRGILDSLLPVIILDILWAILPTQAVVCLSRTPIAKIVMEQDVVFDRDIGRAIVGVDSLARSELIVDDVANDLFAVSQRCASEAIGVDATSIGQELHVIEDQVIGDDVVLRGIRLRGLLDFIRPASPANRDPGIGGVIDLVMLDS